MGGVWAWAKSIDEWRAPIISNRVVGPNQRETTGSEETKFGRLGTEAGVM